MGSTLEGKTALVTGAGRGMGRAIAERLGASGALVAILDAQPADAAVQAITAQGGRAFAVQATIGAPGGVDAMIAGLDRGLRDHRAPPGLDILVNNIGGGHYVGFEDTSAELLRSSWSLNVEVPFLITQALLDRLVDGGRLINISSAGARLPDPAFIAYGMAKASVDYFTRALARLLGPRGITVNAVAPGTTNIETNAEAMKDPAVVKAITDDTLLGRVGQPDDIAGIVHALASSDGGWITGQVIDATGGYRL